MVQKSDFERLADRKKKKSLFQKFYDRLAERFIPPYINYTSPETRRDFINERIRRSKAAMKVFTVAYIAFIIALEFFVGFSSTPIFFALYIIFAILSMAQFEAGHVGMFILSFVLMTVLHPIIALIPLLTSVGMAISCGFLKIYESVDTSIPLKKFYSNDYSGEWDSRTELFGGDKEKILSTAREAAADEREKTISTADITKQQISEHMDEAKIAAEETAAEFRDIVDSVFERAKETDSEDEQRVKNARLILYCLIILGVIPVCFWCGGSVLNPYSGLYFMGVAATLTKKPMMHVPYFIICLLYIFVLELANPLLTISYTICIALGVLLLLLNMDITTTRFSGKGNVEEINPSGSWSRTNVTPEGFSKHVPNPVNERETALINAHTAASGAYAGSLGYREAEEMRKKLLAPDRPSKEYSLINEEKIPEVLFEGLPAEEPPAQPVYTPPAPPAEMEEISLSSAADFEQSLIEFAENSGGSARSSELDSEEMGSINISAALESNNVDMTNNSTDRGREYRGGMGSVNLETAFEDNAVDMTNSPEYKRYGEGAVVSNDFRMSASDERNVLFSQNIFSNIKRKDGDIKPSVPPAKPVFADKESTPAFNAAKPVFTPAQPADNITSDFPDASFAIPETDSDFGAPSVDFGAPSTDFGAPSTDFGAAKVDFGAPSTDFGAASVDFGTPSTDFGASSVDFGAPSTDFGAAKVDFDVPRVDFGVQPFSSGKGIDTSGILSDVNNDGE